MCDQQKKMSQLSVIAVTNTNIFEGNFPSILFVRDNWKSFAKNVIFVTIKKKTSQILNYLQGCSDQPSQIIFKMSKFLKGNVPTKLFSRDNKNPLEKVYFSCGFKICPY